MQRLAARICKKNELIMELFSPDLGLFVWTVIGFLIFAFLMKKFAWKPLLSMLKARETAIEEALEIAEKARKEFVELEQRQKQMIDQVQQERIKILQETRDERAKIMTVAKDEAVSSATKIITEARKEIEREREIAMSALKNEVLNYSVKIAEMILKQKLEQDTVQKQLLAQYLKDTTFN